MSILEKAITLLEDMPKQTVETVYAFMLSIHPKEDINPDNTKSMDAYGFYNLMPEHCRKILIKRKS